MKGLTAEMKRRTLLVGCILLLGGCAASLPYQKAESPDGNGYTDTAGDTAGSFQVDYMAEGKTPAFAKYAAYYRAAELAFETGYRYFIPLKDSDITRKGKTWNPNTPSEVIPGWRVTFQCYMQKPTQPSYNVEQYLNTAKQPGSPLPYPVDQRRGDQAANGGEMPK